MSEVNAMFGRKRETNDFADEIEAHLQLETETLREQGLSDEEARYAALRAFGNVTRTRERFYERRRWLWWDHFWQDVRFSLRMLRSIPTFTTVAILTLALGIGATTAIFSVVDATLLHPLPYPQPEQLVSIEDDLPGVGGQNVGLSEPEWQDLQRSGIFEYVSPDWFDENNLTSCSLPARVRLMSVAPNYFALLGVKPQIGTIFDPNNHTPGYTGEVLISDALWRRSFGADPLILERSVRLDTDLYRIIGVMPPGFHAPGRTTEERNIDVWAATSFYGEPMLDNPPRSGRNIPDAIARLKPGETIAEAQSRLDSLIDALQKQYPDDYPLDAAWTVRLVPLKETVVGDVRQSLFLLLGAVGLVLLIGCVNVANLLLARASSRGREIAIRQALGAARGRLMRQLLTESLLLALLGGIAGLAILFFARGSLLRLVPDSLPRVNDISVSGGVLLFALGASLVAGAVFGMAPALHAGRVDVNHMLKQEGRGSTGSREQARTRRALVVTEFALSLVLMIAASLLLRSFWDLLNVRLGFDPHNVMSVRTRLPYPNDVKIDLYRTPAQQGPFFREVLSRMRTLPGVEEAAVGNMTAIPLDHSQRDVNLLRIIFEGRGTQANEASLVCGSVVTPEYFHLMGMTLVEGRLFSESDDDKSPQVAVINQGMARTYWPNENPLGKRLKLSPSAASWATVVGIVADARTESLADPGVPLIFASLYQRGSKHLAIFLRGRLDSATIPGEVREAVQSINPDLPVYGAQMLNDVVSASLAEKRFAMVMVGLFALTALLLAGLGIYGVISYLIAERAHEIGLRLALGAQRRDIMQMVLRQGFAVAALGAAVGLVFALIVSELMAGMLYGVRPTDPLTFVAVVVLLIGAAALACYVPARRAMSLDPMMALRYE